MSRGMGAQRNYHGVSDKMWAGWTELARSVFNDVYSRMTESPAMFAGITDAAKRWTNVGNGEGHWRVTAWNAAKCAAEKVSRSERLRADAVGRRVLSGGF